MMKICVEEFTIEGRMYLYLNSCPLSSRANDDVSSKTRHPCVQITALTRAERVPIRQTRALVYLNAKDDVNWEARHRLLTPPS